MPRTRRSALSVRTVGTIPRLFARAFSQARGYVQAFPWMAAMEGMTSQQYAAHLVRQAVSQYGPSVLRGGGPPLIQAAIEYMQTDPPSAGGKGGGGGRYYRRYRKYSSSYRKFVRRYTSPYIRVSRYYK